MYKIKFTKEFDRQFSKINNKNSSLAKRVLNAIEEISQNPEHYKPLRNILKGKRRKHIGHFVLTFSFRNEIVYIENFAHHDNIY